MLWDHLVYVAKLYTLIPPLPLPSSSSELLRGCLWGLQASASPWNKNIILNFLAVLSFQLTFTKLKSLLPVPPMAAMLKSEFEPRVSNAKVPQDPERPSLSQLPGRCGQ